MMLEMQDTSRLLSLRDRPLLSSQSNSAFDSQQHPLLRKRGRSSDPGNRLSTAFVVSSTSRTQTIRNTVGKGDVDFFKLTLNQSRSLDLFFLNKSNVGISGTILLGDGRSLASIRIDAKKTYAIPLSSAVVPPGVYYLRIASNQRGKHAYELKLAIR